MKKDKVIVAVSGGPDSMYLLNYLRRKNYETIVANVNFDSRKYANRDQDFVEKYCLENNIKLYKKKVKESEWGNVRTKNWQAAARRLRYDFFWEVAKKEGVNVLYVGHQRDDWLETAIMLEERSDNFLYYGIKEYETYKDLEIIRPLLKLYKEDLIRYNNKVNIPFVIDETNIDRVYKRNAIRSNLLTLDKRSKKKIEKHFIKINKSKSYFRKIIYNLFSDWQDQEFDWKFFNEIKDKYKKNTIYLFLTRNGEEINVNDEKLEAIKIFLKSNARKREFRLMENLILIIKEGKIKIIKK